MASPTFNNSNYVSFKLAVLVGFISLLVYQLISFSMLLNQQKLHLLQLVNAQEKLISSLYADHNIPASLLSPTLNTQYHARWHSEISLTFTHLSSASISNTHPTNSATQLTFNSFNTPELVAYARLNVGGERFVLIAKQNLASLSKLFISNMMKGTIALILIVTFVTLLGRVTPIGKRINSIQYVSLCVFALVFSSYTFNDKTVTQHRFLLDEILKQHSLLISISVNKNITTDILQKKLVAFNADNSFLNSGKIFINSIESPELYLELYASLKNKASYNDESNTVKQRISASLLDNTGVQIYHDHYDKHLYSYLYLGSSKIFLSAKMNTKEISLLLYQYIFVVSLFSCIGFVIYRFFIQQRQPQTPALFFQRTAPKISDKAFYIGVTLILIVSIIVDLYLPATLLTNLGYVFIIFAAWWLKQAKAIVVLSSIVSLVLASVFVYHLFLNNIQWESLVDRLAALSLIWVLALTFLRSISEKQQEKVRQYELKNIVDSITDAVVIIDKNQLVVEFTKSAEIVFGHAADAVLGKPFDFLIPDKFKPLHGEYLTSPTPETIKKLSQHRDITAKHALGHTFDATIKINQFSLGGSLFYCIICRDISIEKCTIKAIQDSEERLAHAQRLTSLGNWEWHVKTDQLFWSKEMYRLWGIPYNTPVTYESFFSRLHDDDKSTVQLHVNKALEGGGFSVEYRIVTDDGTLRHIYAEGEVTFDNGEPTVFMGTSQDISQRKKHLDEISEYQNQLEALIAEKSEQLDNSNAANEAKSRFLANVSHELRTPLHGIIAAMDLLKHTDLTAKQANFVDIAKISADNFLGLINEVLDYSKIESSEISLELLTVDIRDLVVNIVKSLSFNARNKNIALSCVIEPNTPRLITSDGQKLKQILLNLLSNAIKFTHTQENKQGSVRVTVEQSNETLFIHVKDNGIGMSEEILQEVYKPFVQADNSTSRQYGGTGLGLSIANNLVELLSGELQCESHLNKGTEFTVSIPIEIVQEEETSDQLLTVNISGIKNFYTQALVNEFRFRGHTITLDSRTINKNGSNPLYITVRNDSGNCRYFYIETIADALPEENSNQFEKIDAFPFIPTHICQFIHQSMTPESPENNKITEKENEISLTSDINVLIAEDNEHNCEVISFQMEELGLKHQIVNDGEQALKALENGTYDLLITDCHMPKLDGYELTTQLRQSNIDTIKSTPIIGMTGDVSADSLEKCQRVGMNGVIAKPSRINQISDKIKEVLALTKSQGNTALEGQESFDEHESAQRLSDDIAKSYIGEDDSMLLSFRRNFITKSTHLITELQNAVVQQDLKKLFHTSHKLKSSSLFIGAEKLHVLCKHLELVTANETHDIDEQIRWLVDTLANEFHLLKNNVLADKTELEPNKGR